MNKTQTPASSPLSTSGQEHRYVKLPLSKLNFLLMAVAGAMIVIGFLLMTGSASTATEFNPEIFSTRRIVVGPTIAFLGFIFMGFGIMWPSRSKKQAENTEEQA